MPSLSSKLQEVRGHDCYTNRRIRKREREKLHTTQREGIPKTSYHKYIKKQKKMEVNGLRLKALQHLAWQVYYSEKSIMYIGHSRRRLGHLAKNRCLSTGMFASDNIVRAVLRRRVQNMFNITHSIPRVMGFHNIQLKSKTCIEMFFLSNTHNIRSMGVLHPNHN